MIEGDGNLFSLMGDSTINHVGFLLLALAVFSNSSIESFVFYIIQYTITNLNIFLIILALSYIINKRIDRTFTLYIDSKDEKKWLIYNPSLNFSQGKGQSIFENLIGIEVIKINIFDNVKNIFVYK